MENDPCWQNVTDIFQRKVRAKDVVRALEARGETVSRERDDLIDDNVKAIENILDREFPEQTIPVKATIREAIDIFYRSEEHTSELQSLMRISYAVFCLKKKTQTKN